MLIPKTTRISADSNLLIHVVVTFLIHVLYALLVFFIGALLARAMTVGHFGLFEYCESIIEVLMAVGLLGFDRQLISRISGYNEGNEWGNIRGVIILARYLNIVCSVCLCLFVVIAANYWPFESQQYEFSDTGFFRVTLIIAAITIPMRVLIRHNQAVAHGFQRVALSHIPDFIVRPVILLLSVVVINYFFTMVALNALSVMCVYFFSAVIALFVSFAILKVILPEEISAAEWDFKEKNQWLKSLFPLVVMTVSTLLSLKIGTILLGSLNDFELVARFSVVMRIALVVNLIPLAINKVLAPKFSAYYYRGEKDKLRTLIKQSVYVCITASLCTGGVCAVFAENILFLFGQAYVNIDLVLSTRIFLLINALLAPTGVLIWVLIMTNYEWVACTCLLVSLTIGVFLYLYLSMKFNVLGAVSAYLAVGIIRAIMAFFFVRKLRVTG